MTSRLGTGKWQTFFYSVITVMSSLNELSTNRLGNRLVAKGGGGGGVTPHGPHPFYSKLLHGHIFKDDVIYTAVICCSCWTEQTKQVKTVLVYSAIIYDGYLFGY